MLRRLLLAWLLFPIPLFAQGGGIPSGSGWFNIPNTAYQSLGTAACPTTPDFQGGNDCSAIINSWSSAVADTIHNWLIFWGGGHHDWCANTVFKLDLVNLTVAAMDLPSSMGGATCSGVGNTETMGDGAASSRHTYDGITFDPSARKMFSFGGIIIGNGTESNEIWSIIPSNLNPAATGGGVWQHLSPTFTSSGLLGEAGNISDYNPVTDSIWLMEPTKFPGQLWEYTRGNNTMNLRQTYNSGVVIEDHQNGIIDPKRQIMLIAGNGVFFKALLTPPYTLSALNATNCTAVTNPAFPGMAYDEIDTNTVFWTGGNSVWVYNPDTNACTQETYSNGPTTVGTNGVFGHFRRFPALQAFATINSKGENAFTLRRNVDVTVNAFANRAAGVNTSGGAASIVSSQNFDTFPVTNHQQYFQLNVPSRITTDCSQPNTDGCALHFSFVNGDFQAGPGWFNYNFCDPTVATCLYGPGQEFFVQYRERISTTATQRSSWDSGFTDWKMGILREGDSATSQANNCSNVPTDLVLDSDFGHSAQAIIPWIYENCGQYGNPFKFLVSQFQPMQIPAGAIGSGENLDQDATGCTHTNLYISVTDPTCFSFAANEWFTVQAHVKYGTNGQPNSTVEMWVQHPGQASRLVTNFVDDALDVQSGQPIVTGKFGAIVLLPYATGATWLTNVDYWYDDLIISNRRIPDSDIGIPNAPDSATISASTSNSATVSWRVNSNNGTAQDDIGFLVERCSGVMIVCLGNPQSGFSQIATTAAHASSFTDNTVNIGTTYTYRVRANNSTGNSAYSIGICVNNATVSCGTTVQIQSGSSSPAVSMSPTSATYASRLQGTTSSPTTFTITNSGTATLVLGTPFFSFTGTNANDFANSGGGTCVNGGSVLVGQGCTITVTFHPTSIGAESATLNILGNASGTASLSGSSTVASLLLKGGGSLSGGATIVINP